MNSNLESSTLFKRILLVVENRTLAAQICDVLDLHFFEVTVASRGAEAVQELISRSFDAVICDLTIPTLPAEMFFHAVNRIRPELSNRVITLSDASTSKTARPAGAVCIWKPVDPQILVEAIEGVFKKADRLASAGRCVAA